VLLIISFEAKHRCLRFICKYKMDRKSNSSSIFDAVEHSKQMHLFLHFIILVMRLFC